MKERALRAAATCTNCGEKIGKSGVPMFWRVRIQRLGLDLRALQRQSGLEMMMGSVGLARALSPDEEMTVSVAGPLTVTICEDCADKRICLLELLEKTE